MGCSKARYAFQGTPLEPAAVCIPSKTVCFLEQIRLGAHTWVLFCVLFWIPPTLVPKGQGFPVLFVNLNVIIGTVWNSDIFCGPQHPPHLLEEYRRQDLDLVDKKCAAMRMVSGSKNDKLKVILLPSQVAPKSTFGSTTAASKVVSKKIE